MNLLLEAVPLWIVLFILNMCLFLRSLVHLKKTKKKLTGLSRNNVFWQRCLNFGLWSAEGILESNNILNPLQSDFRTKHSPATAALKVFNDVFEELEWKGFCVALFIGLFKAFDTVDRSLWLEILFKTSISK